MFVSRRVTYKKHKMLLWFNPSWTDHHTAARSLLHWWDGGENWKGKKLVGSDRNSLITKKK